MSIKRVKDVIRSDFAPGVREGWSYKFKEYRPHPNYDTGEIDGQTVELVICHDSFGGYKEDASNYGETVVVHHIGATERTYAGFEAGMPCEIEVEAVNPKCGAFIDRNSGRAVGYINGFEVYGKVKKAAK